MSIFEVPHMASSKTLEVLGFVDRILKNPGPLTDYKKTIITQVQDLFTSFVRSPNITHDINAIHVKNDKLLVSNAELAIQNLTLQIANKELALCNGAGRETRTGL
jgi:hypothetical protein